MFVTTTYYKNFRVVYNRRFSSTAEKYANVQYYHIEQINCQTIPHY